MEGGAVVSNIQWLCSEAVELPDMKWGSEKLSAANSSINISIVNMNQGENSGEYLHPQPHPYIINIKKYAEVGKVLKSAFARTQKTYRCDDVCLFLIRRNECVQRQTFDGNLT